VRACAACGQENPDIARFCLACGAPLGQEAPPAEERRVVTILFSDLVGFTARAEALDPEDVRAILERYHAAAKEEIERFGGTVEKFVGDAVMAVFGAPVAYGDDAERAVRAALAVLEALKRLNAADPLLDLQARLAVNTGEAVVDLGARPGHGEAMVAGDVVNTAARLQSAAPVGGVLVGRETYRATRAAIEYVPGEPVVAKGKADPVAVWLAMGAATGAGERVLSRVPMVGRTRELAVLREIWERAADERRPHLVTVFGTAGIGKSRLALEFANLVTELGGRALRGRSTPYGASSPYAAFAQHVKQVARIFDNDPVAAASAKLRASVEELVDGASADELASDLAVLVGLRTDHAAVDREALLYAARVLTESLALRHPLLLVFEDIHWADTSLLDLLEDLAARTRDAPVLLLALARPELLSTRPAWGGGLPAYTALRLEPLGGTDAVELAARLLEHHASFDPVDHAERIAGMAEGNPLFLEELAASLAERPAAAAKPELPTSIRALVAARLDALPAAERSVVLDASVVGRVFWAGVLERISNARELPSLLASLERRDFIRREAVSRIQGDRQYSFKHALIRDVAYLSLPRARRRSAHLEVARFLEETTGETGAPDDALAGHWREAGEAGKAIQHLLAAAEQAGRGWAKERAVALYRQALQLADDPEVRREIGKRQAVALQALYHVSDAAVLRRGEAT
jgi:class 3 adenylate cyclase